SMLVPAIHILYELGVAEETVSAYQTLLLLRTWPVLKGCLHRERGVPGIRPPPCNPDSLGGIFPTPTLETHETGICIGMSKVKERQRVKQTVDARDRLKPDGAPLVHA